MKSGGAFEVVAAVRITAWKAVVLGKGSACQPMPPSAFAMTGPNAL